MTTFVLVHGGAHGAWCWAPLIPFLEAPALAVDLPGRGKRPADLDAVNCEDFAASVVADIEKAGLSDVILVGHSMAGLTLPRVAERIPQRLKRLIFVSCLVPPHGQNSMEIQDSPARQALRQAGAEERRAGMLPESVARAMFCNDMDEAQTRFVLENLGSEAPQAIGDASDLSGLRHPIPRSYVRLARDAALSLDVQNRSIAALGEVEVVDLDTGHNVMISHPEPLARILNERLG